MFEFYRECSFELQSSTSWVVILTAIIALFALIVNFINLNALKRAQCVQSHMHLINLENEIRKNSTSFFLLVKKCSFIVNSEYPSNEIITLEYEKDIAFELYICSVDKIASLINTEYLKNQFKRDWKKEYFDIFKDAKSTFEEYPIIKGKNGMIRNLKSTLEDWNRIS